MGREKSCRSCAGEDGIGQKSWPNGCKYAASLSELLDKMQKSGWIQRRVNEKDRRKINIFLTEDGLGISQQMIEARRDMVNTVFGVLNAQGARTVGNTFVQIDLGTGKTKRRRAIG